MGYGDAGLRGSALMHECGLQSCSLATLIPEILYTPCFRKKRPLILLAIR